MKSDVENEDLDLDLDEFDFDEDDEDLKAFRAAVERDAVDMAEIEAPPRTRYEKVYALLLGQEALELNRAAQKEYRARLDLEKPRTILGIIKVGWAMTREAIKDAMEERRRSYY